MSVEKFRKVKNAPAEPPPPAPLSPAALEVLWLLVGPQSKMALNVSVAQMDVLNGAIKELRGWAQTQIDAVMKAQSQPQAPPQG